jgi:redox-sensitive bicupin YhaK (pirin superfamily)
MRAAMLTIEPRAAALELDGLTVGRILPWVRRRTVGPFVFLDVMGPTTLGPTLAMDVRPHPHIGLATVTYLFDGSITHRDSLGCTQDIRPGEINWMIAGRGITHSERTPDGLRGYGWRCQQRKKNARRPFITSIATNCRSRASARSQCDCSRGQVGE